MLKLVQLRSMHSEIIPTSCNERTPTSYILRFFWCAKRALACINDINIYQQDVKNSFHWILALYFMDVRPAPQNAGLAPHWNYKKGFHVFLINICLTLKSLDVFSSTEGTGGHQDHLLYLYLLMTTPNSQIHIRKPFVWVSVNLCAFPPPRGFSPLPCPAGLIALCISVCLFFNKLVFGSWKHSLLLDDSLWRR